MSGLPSSARTIVAYASYCSSSVGASSRPRNRNSVRMSPTPSAPASTACAASAARLMLAPISTRWPSVSIAG